MLFRKVTEVQRPCCCPKKKSFLLEGELCTCSLHITFSVFIWNCNLKNQLFICFKEKFGTVLPIQKKKTLLEKKKKSSFAVCHPWWVSEALGGSCAIPQTAPTSPSGSTDAALSCATALFVDGAKALCPCADLDVLLRHLGSCKEGNTRLWDKLAIWADCTCAARST